MTQADASQGTRNNTGCDHGRLAIENPRRYSLRFLNCDDSGAVFSPRGALPFMDSSVRRSFFGLVNGAVRVDLHVLLCSGNFNFPIPIAHVVLGAIRGYGRDRDAADNYLHLSRSIELKAAMVEYKFVPLKLNHGFRLDENAGAFHVNSGGVALLSLDQRVGEDCGHSWHGSVVQPCAAVVVKQSTIGILRLREKRRRQEHNRDPANEFAQFGQTNSCLRTSRLGKDSLRTTAQLLTAMMQGRSGRGQRLWRQSY